MVRASDDPQGGDGDQAGAQAPATRRGERADTPRELPQDDEGRPRRRWYRRPLPLLALTGLVLIIAIGILIWWLDARQWEKTDDATIAADIAPVTTRIAGTVARVLVAQNQDVAAGAVLVEIDPKPFQNRLDQARAALSAANAAQESSRASSASAEAEVAAARAEAERRSADLKRYESLDPRVVSQQQVDAARAAAQSAEAQLRVAQTRLTGAKAAIGEAQARIEQAQAASHQSELELSYTSVRAALGGRVTQKSVQVGQYLHVGQVLMALVPQEVFVIANFKETQITRMHPGQEARIEIDAYPKHTFRGHVESIQAGSDAAFSLLPPENATGNFVKVVQRVPVKIVFEPGEAQHWLLGPGMSAVPKVRIAGDHDGGPAPISPPASGATATAGQ